MRKALCVNRANQKGAMGTSITSSNTEVKYNPTLGDEEKAALWAVPVGLPLPHKLGTILLKLTLYQKVGNMLRIYWVS